MSEMKKIKRKELKDFVESSFFKDLETIPISTKRALSQFYNPHAEDEDTLLYLIFEEERLVAYLGTFPAWVQCYANKQKCAWLSCIWVHHSQRGKGLAKRLVQTAIDDYQGRILITEFTPQARQLYDKIGQFNELKVVHGKRYYYRWRLQDILPPKHKLFAQNKTALKAIDSVVNIFFDLRFLWKKNQLKKEQVEIVSEIDESLSTFIQNIQKDLLFSKSVEYYNWMLRFPWLKEGIEQTDESKRYHFTLLADDFKWQAFKLLNRSGNIEAFVMLCRRDGFLKVPVCIHKNAVLVAQFIREYCDKKTHTISIYEEEICKHLKLNALYTKRFNREYRSTFCDKIDQEINALRIEGSEGDSAFT